MPSAPPRCTNRRQSVVASFYSPRTDYNGATFLYRQESSRMTAEFTPEETARLAPFFTNLDRSTFGLKLPQEVAGALFSRYSRSAKRLRRTLLHEFLGAPGLGLRDPPGAPNTG